MVSFCFFVENLKHEFYSVQELFTPKGNYRRAEFLEMDRFLFYPQGSQIMELFFQEWLRAAYVEIRISEVEAF